MRLAMLVLVGCGDSSSPSVEDDSGGELVVEEGQSPPGESDHGECPQYIACVSVVAPGELADPLGLVGEEGSCWEDPNAVAGCEQMCASELERLLTANPTVEACGGGPLEFPFDAGAWSITSFEGELCGAEGYISSFELSFGEFRDEFVWEVLGLPYGCTLDGDDFVCADGGLSGTFTSQSRMEATLSDGVPPSEGGCEADFEARRD